MKNHAGAFYHIADLPYIKGGYRLVHFDAHSDATAIAGSDFIRRTLKDTQYPERLEQFKKWKARGLIQSFNWIEPLIPDIIDSVIWVAERELSGGSRKKFESNLKREINSYVNWEKRSQKDLSSYVRVCDLSILDSLTDSLTGSGISPKENPEENKEEHKEVPTVISIDLDFFAHMKKDQMQKAFAKVIRFTRKTKNLAMVVIAISRPYLLSDEQANGLLYEALTAFSGFINAKVYFEAFEFYGPDKSRLAVEYYRHGKTPPEFSLEKINDSLRNFFLTHRDKVIVEKDQKRWQKYLKKWDRRIGVKPVIYEKDKEGSRLCQNQCRLKKDSTITLRLNQPLAGAIQWYAVKATQKEYNLMEGKGFATKAEQNIYYSETPLLFLKGRTTVNGQELKSLFDSLTGWGTVRIFAEVIQNKQSYRSNMLTLIRRKSNDFTGWLTEIFNLPYIFGSAFLRNGGRQGPDTLYGAECATFIIYAIRKSGVMIPYVDPGNLKKYLKTEAVVDGFKNGVAYNSNGPVKIRDIQIKKGLLLHFGSHVAALYKDKAPFHVLSKNDLVIHQLEGFGEIKKLGDLQQAQKPFFLMTVGTQTKILKHKSYHKKEKEKK